MPRQENTYEKILDTALNLLASNGYEGTSIKNITDQVGLTKAAFYAHFHNKSELLGKLIESYERDYIDVLIRRVSEQPGTAIDKLHRVISFSSGVGLKHRKGAIMFYSLSDDMKADMDIEPIRKRCSQKMADFLAGLFEEGKKEGLIRDDLDSGMLALLLMSFSRGMFLQSVDNAPRISGETYVRTFRRVFMQGIQIEGGDHGK
ncbi:MAG: TetR/AcrR family transcriptional regulator [Deltaproteobacteria bacterium]|nr:TetR/AcrR family transcriptional regulator [Deltaproteobacteria bacterium]